MIKLTFKQTINTDGSTPVTETATGDTPLQALARLEQEISKQLSVPVNLAEDTAVDWDKLIEAVENRQLYQRLDFSSPEENFDITAEDVPDEKAEREYAKLVWLPEDITGRTKLSKTEAADWLARNEKYIRDRLCEWGQNDVIPTLLSMDGIKCDEEGEKPEASDIRILKSGEITWTFADSSEDRQRYREGFVVREVQIAPSSNKGEFDITRDNGATATLPGESFVVVGCNHRDRSTPVMGSVVCGCPVCEAEWPDDEDGEHGHCDTCGAPCDAAGCTKDRTHEIANPG